MASEALGLLPIENAGAFFGQAPWMAGMPASFGHPAIALHCSASGVPAVATAFEGPLLAIHGHRGTRASCPSHSGFCPSKMLEHLWAAP